MNWLRPFREHWYGTKRLRFWCSATSRGIHCALWNGHPGRCRFVEPA